MSINFPNLFTRLGKVVGAFRAFNGVVSTGPPSPAATWGSGPTGMSGANIRCLNDVLTAIQSQLQNPFPELLSGGQYGVSQSLYSLQTSMPQTVAAATLYFQSLAQGLIVDTVNADTTLAQQTIQYAYAELTRQAISQSVTIHSNNLGSVVTAGGSNVGNPSWVVSLIDVHGQNLQYAYSETMVAVTTRDANDGSTAGNETITVTAPKGSVLSSLNYAWPSGNGYASGFTGSFTVVDPTQSNGSGGNILNNSSFKATWVANQPPNWIADVGVAGTNWQDGTSNNYGGTAHCFEFLGDGATLASVYQSFANNSGSGGNTTTLQPETVYLFRAKVKLSAANPAAGVLAFSITDGAGNVINDDTGNPLTISTNLANVGNTNYNDVSGAFRMPIQMPATGPRLRMKLTTALTNGKNVFIDYMGMTQCQQASYGGIYQGGPYVAVFRGSTDTLDYNVNPVTGDRWTVQITNDYGGLWQTLLWQLLSIPTQMGLPFPNAQTPTLADTLIS